MPHLRPFKELTNEDVVNLFCYDGSLPEENMPKFGVLACMYDCADYVDAVLKPWLGRDNVELAIVHAQFKEYADMGKPNIDSPTIGRLVPYSGVIKTFIEDKPLTEAEARNIPLKYLLERNCDYIWLLDGDEFYTERQIDRIIEFVEMSRKTAWFKIPFKNYVFDGSQWIDGFCPPRIFRTKYLEWNLSKFYWDNDVGYTSGTLLCQYDQMPSVEIPRSVAHVKHLTWLHSNGKKKWEYQMKHFGHCSYKWNNETNKLEFDLDFHAKHGIPLPILNSD
jgi:hypothetical protein